VGVAAYAAVLRDRGLRHLLAVSQAARLGASMLPLSLVLFGASTAGSPAAGGAVLAGFVATSTLHPARARLVDRWGAVALAGFVVGFVALLGALAALGAASPAAGLLVAGAALAGAFAPPLGAFTRAVAGAALRSRPEILQRAYALDSAAEEASLVLAPLLVGLIVAVWTETAAVLVGAGLMLAGGLATARTPLAERLPTRRQGAVEAAALPERIWLVIASFAATGAALGAIDVAVPSITRAAGMPALAGVLLAAMAVGTATAGLVAGLQSSRRPPLQRLAILQPALALGLAGCALVHPLGPLAAALTVPGAVLGILFVTAYVAIDDLAPHGSATRAFAWLIAANNAGLAVGAALAGALADKSPHAALWLAAVAALPGSVLAAAAATRRQTAH
jgi:MFS family permease